MTPVRELSSPQRCRGDRQGILNSKLEPTETSSLLRSGRDSNLVVHRGLAVGLVVRTEVEEGEALIINILKIASSRVEGADPTQHKRRLHGSGRIMQSHNGGRVGEDVG